MMEMDLLNRPMTDDEREIRSSYLALKKLAAREDLPPCAARNVRKALACLWQEQTGLLESK